MVASEQAKNAATVQKAVPALGQVNRTTIKLCGFQTEEDVAAVHGLSVQYAGFVLAPSKRQVTVETLSRLVVALPPAVIPVAVTVNASDAHIEAVIEQADVRALQLHGDESPARCQELRARYGCEVQLIKALPARGPETVTAIAAYSRVVEKVLVDAYQLHARGGTGRTFQWGTIPLYKEACQRAGSQLLIAGGLHADNVRALVRQYAPDGVDVSSGIESSGRKSAARMKQFVETVRKAERAGAF